MSLVVLSNVIPQHVPSGLSLDAPTGAVLVIINQIIMEEEYGYGETGSLSNPRVRGCSRVDYLKLRLSTKSSLC